jgi:hypothetical protein
MLKLIAMMRQQSSSRVNGPCGPSKRFMRTSGASSEVLVNLEKVIDGAKTPDIPPRVFR